MMQQPLHDLPVIVGCGLTGIAISRALSRDRIKHVLIGAAPKPGLRLGESLNLEGSLDLVALFPELKRHTLPKTAVTAHVGGLEARCDLNMSGTKLTDAFYGLLGYETPEAFLHVDRIRFDVDAFEAVVADSHCHHIDDYVVSVDANRGADRIDGLTLRSGVRIRPKYVFDATNQIRLVANAIGLESRVLGEAQRVAYAHYPLSEAGRRDRELFETTHVVRLSNRDDGVDAVGWFIPLSDYASIGVSVDDPGSELNGRDLTDCLMAALARRGILRLEDFVPPTEERQVPRHSHFMYERAFGANWLLAGGSFCQIWFGAGAGISSGLAAATCAAQIIDDPLRFGMRYDKLAKELVSPHGVFDWLRRIDADTRDIEELRQRGGRLVHQSLLRLAMSLRLRAGRRQDWLGRALTRLVRANLVDLSRVCQTSDASSEQRAA
jgi:flavin-dependent dehydrogenase